MNRRLTPRPDRVITHGWHALAVTVFLFCMLSTSGFSQDFTAQPSAPTRLEPSLTLSREYFHAAQSEYSMGRIDSALVQIARGLEIDALSSDLLLLRAIIETAQSGQIRSARADALAALEANRFVEGSPSAALRRLADILRKMHAWDELVTRVGKLVPDTELVKYPEILASKVDALQALGRGEQAQSLIRTGLSRYPDHTGIVAVALKYQAIPAAAAFLWFNRFHSSDESYRLALFWYLYHLEPGAERLKRVNDYLSLGGTDSSAIPIGLESLQSLGTVSAEDESLWLGRLLTKSGPLDLDAARRISDLLQAPQNKKRLSDFLLSPHLSAYRDYDHDGRFEEQMHFVNGHIVQWHVDTNENDLADLDLEFRDDIPVHAHQEREGRSVSFDYAAYPELARFVVQQNGIQIEYLLPHRAQDLHIVDLPVDGMGDPLRALDFLKLPMEPLKLDPERFADSAWLTNEYRGVGADAHLQSQTRWERGIPIAQRVDTNNDGRLDTLYWFDNGVRVMGFRDIEDSGIFSVVELYEKGKLSQVTFVSPQEGYSYQLKPSSGLAAWDLNHDHRIDIQEMHTANAWLFQEFNRGTVMQSLAQGKR